MESVLETIKKMLGIVDDYKEFDDIIITHINAVFLNLHQIGIGPETIPTVTSSSDTWDELLGNMKNLEAVKTYVYYKVRLAFDPPTVSSVLEAMKNLATELEWRLNLQVESEKEG